MTTKSILDIEVNDAQFKRFKELYDKYQASLDKLPGAWKTVGKETEKSASHFSTMTAALMAQNQLIKEFYRTTDKAGKTLQHHSSLWTRIVKSTTGVLGNVVGIARWLTRMGVGLGLGALGAGTAGLLGLRGVAESVSNQRNFALGTGTTIGQEQAFRQHQARNLSNPDQVLRSAFLAQSVGTPQNVLAHILGISTRGGPYQIADRMLQAVQALAKRTPANLVGQLPNMYPQLAAAGFSLPDIEALRTLSTSELNKQIRQGGHAAAAQGLSDKQAAGFQNFLSSISTTFGTVAKDVEKDLLPLLGPIQKFIRSLGKDVSIFLRSGAAAKGIDEMAGAIAKFTSYLGSDDFQKTVTSISNASGALVTSVKAVVNVLKPIFELVGKTIGTGAGMATVGAEKASDEWKKFSGWFDANFKASPIPVSSTHNVHVKSTVTVKNQTGSNIHASVNALNGGT